MAKKARFWTDLKANQIALDYIVLGRSGTTQNKPFWTGPKCPFWNSVLWAQVNDFRSSRSNFDGSRQALWGLSRKGVQVPFMTPPDSSNVICPLHSLVVNKKYCDRGDKGLKIGTQVNIDMLIRSGRVPETSGMRGTLIWAENGIE